MDDNINQGQDVLAQMSLDEKLELITGMDNFYTHGVPRLGIRRIRMADATMGLRDACIPATAFPSSILLAATWNRKLAFEYGSAVGAEFRAADIDVVLGPGINIYRIPHCGRNFEYFGEDPILTATLCCEYIKGVQGQGVAATVKHLAANNSDWHRCASNSAVDERTLREVYLPAFEAAIKEAGVLSVMTSYNLLNGVYPAESEWLLRNIVMGEWGFQGVIMSDWEGTWNAEKAFNSGLHLEMPGKKTWALDTLKSMLADGRMRQEELDAKCLTILKWGFAIDHLKSASPTGQRRCRAHSQVCLEVARKGIVLLKNSAAALPLKTTGGRINIVGPCAFPTPTGGGGAAKVDALDAKSVLGSLSDLAPDVEIIRGESRIESASAVVVCVGFNDKTEHEGSDRPFELPWEQEALIRRCTQANANTIVVLFAGGSIAMASWVDEVSAILHAWYPGECGALAVAEILLGLVNPCGKLPISIERHWKDAPAYGHYLPDGATQYENPNYVGRHRPQFDVKYEEGVFCGYRHYDRTGIEPLFAFGHGLSYTTFEYSELTVLKEPDGGVLVSFTITNTGSISGDEIAQIYVSDLEASVPRPTRELKAFEVVSLGPGQSVQVKTKLGARAFSYYDVASSEWRVEPGEFQIVIGASARDIRLAASIFGYSSDPIESNCNLSQFSS